MYTLSYADLEKITEKSLKDYHNKFGDDYFKLDIFRFAQAYMHLDINHVKLEDGVIGTVTFKETMVNLWDDGYENMVWIPGDTVLLDLSLTTDGQEARERFTLSHECGHRFLHVADFASGNSRIKRPACRVAEPVPHKRLETREDWLEWQASAFAACLMMPRKKVFAAYTMFSEKTRIIGYGGSIKYKERNVIERMAQVFGVSFQAMTIRMEQIGILSGWDHHSLRSFMDILVTEGNKGEIQTSCMPQLLGT